MQRRETMINRQEEAERFVADLTPHRSLGRTGFVILMAFVGLTCFVSGLSFWVMGAWPVLFFFGLDFLAIWIAFRLNYRSGKMRERIALENNELRIEQTSPAGTRAEHIFNPYWTRFEVDRHDMIGITEMRVMSKGRSLAIGGFLNPEDRESFAFAFAGALGRAKQ